MSSDRSVALSSSEPVGPLGGSPKHSSGSARPSTGRVKAGLLDPELLWRSLPDALRKLDARTLWRNPVMFVVEIGSIFTTVLAALQPSVFAWAITVWLWLTVLFANLAEAVAEGRGKAQAETLRRARQETTARRLLDWSPGAVTVGEEAVPATALRLGDIVVVEAGQVIPGDGDVVEGIATVDESVITGESAPVVRESGGDRSAVTGGTKVLSDRIVVRITQQAGESFLERMIALVEGANRQKTPNEIALNILLAALTILFLLAVATLQPLAIYSKQVQAAAPDSAVLSSHGVTGIVLISLLVCLIPTTIGALLSAPKERYGLRARQPGELAAATWVPFSAQTRMSGVDLPSRETDGGGLRVRKGAAAAVLVWVRENGGAPTNGVGPIVDGISAAGGTPLVVAAQRHGQPARPLGVIHLKDVVKTGMRDRFDEMRRMGIRTVMITGDNPLTARAIAAEAGVDDFLAEATPEDKMALIKAEQEGGKLVAMTGDGTNDAPALAQADIGVAMNTGTSAAKEAGNMVDLDSDPTKLIEIVEIGKQLLITRGALTTFSIANDIAKYFAIIPAMFAAVYPSLDRLNIMQLHSPTTAILAAVIFNALIIVALVPLALRGVRYVPGGASALLRHNLLVYGLGGIAAPFVGIKIIDLLLSLIPGIS
jgi:K+-transporting ATPase ATPase B chain